MKKADLHHMELKHGWKLWGWRGFHQDLASGVLKDFFLPMIEPLQEMIACKGTHPHGGNAWLPPEAGEPWRSSEETPFLTQMEWKE